MKKLLLFFVVLPFLSSSCGIRNAVVQASYTVDYSKYSDAGFFITESNSVSFPYKPVSSVSAIFTSGYQVVKKDGKVVMMDDAYGRETPKTTSKYVVANREGALDELCRKAREIGADGVINLKITTLYTPGKYGSIISGYEATGMAIKR